MRDSRARHDAWVASALFVATVLYIAALPHNLGFADESYFLYEAKRIRDGEVLYRDVFQFITPLAPHLMAALYWAFGTTMTTARVTVAVVHGLIVVCTYASARALRIHPALAGAAALAHVAISQPAWPFVSWHWFSSCIASAILLALVRGGWTDSPRRTLGLGLLCGALIGVQQQRGVIPAGGVGLYLLVEHFIDRRYGTHGGGRNLSVRLATFAAGIMLIVVPLLLLFLVVAGVDAMYDALIRYPLESYRASYRTSWGSLTALSARYAADTFPRLLRSLPAVLLIPALRAVLGLARGRQPGHVRQRTALALYSAVSVLSVWYYPDFIHIAFIAVPLFVCAADAVQGGIDAAPLGRAAGTVCWTIAAVVTASLTYHLGTIMVGKQAQYPYAHDTVFGRIDYASRWEPLLVDAVRARLAASPSQEIFCYPNLASPYLTTGGKNPTPFQHFFARVFPPRDTARVVATLEQRRVPFILAALLGVPRDDPIIELIDRAYHPASIPALTGIDPPPGIWLFERNPDSTTPSALSHAVTRY